ncbi:MAG TPA: PadR family transcriptional regulator [Nitrososphaerales archaeon]|nr:PadR family transcriptional regulator [Nitrososphaerales archaeon]
MASKRNIPKTISKDASSKMFKHLLQKPQGAPRGFLQFYILHSISQKPTHGYEISREIDEKTDGAWKPGAGSIYPMLKKLSDEGLIRVTESKKARETAQRVYEITEDGKRHLRERKDMFALAGRKWYSMRRLFIDLMDPDQISNFLVEGSKLQFETSRELVSSKLSKISAADAEFTLREYALNLERQLSWTKEKLSEHAKAAAPQLRRASH